MKKVVVILFIILVILAIPATIFLSGQNQELRKKAAPATTLAFSPAALTKKPGETFSLDITLDTGENQVVAAELHVIFDPAKLEAQSITNSTLFPNILTSGVIERGSASISVGATDVKKPIKGTGSIAVIRLKALENTDVPVSVRLAQNTYVGGIGEGATNVLIGNTPATITISDGMLGTGTNQAQNQPSPTPFVTPSITPTSIPTVTPTGTPMVTPTINTSMSTTLTISAPALNSATTIATPTIRGKAAPGTTVTITIYSTPKTVTVKADANGNWSYTPATPLASGNHNVVASASDITGQTQTATTTFVVAAGGSSVASQSATIIPTPQPIPVSGNTSMTVLFGSIGMALILGSIVFAVMVL